jgi:hypothetical protein
MAAEARPAPAINTAAAMGEAARGVGLHQTPHETVYLLRREHPQVALTWSSKFPQKVDKLKLRKRIHLFPVSITLKADYDTNTREFEYGCSVKVSEQLFSICFFVVVHVRPLIALYCNSVSLHICTMPIAPRIPSSEVVSVSTYLNSKLNTKKESTYRMAPNSLCLAHAHIRNANCSLTLPYN